MIVHLLCVDSGGGWEARAAWGAGVSDQQNMEVLHAHQGATTISSSLAVNLYRYISGCEWDVYDGILVDAVRVRDEPAGPAILGPLHAPGHSLPYNFFSRASPSRKDLTEFVFNFGAFSDDFYAGSCALSLADFVIF